MPGPERIGNIVAELIARRGLGRAQSAAALTEAWSQAGGALAAKFTRVGPLRRGVLEVVVSNSTILQELNFQKAELVERLGQLLPEPKIRGLKFRVGAIE